MMPFSQEKSEAAFNRIHELGGHGIWESDMVVISLDSTDISDEDLALFVDFNFVETLLLSNTQISDAGLVHLEQLARLKSLALIDTNVTEAGIAKLQTAIPNAKIETEPILKDTINPFTGEPFDE